MACVDRSLLGTLVRVQDPLRGICMSLPQGSAPFAVRP